SPQNYRPPFTPSPAPEFTQFLTAWEPPPSMPPWLHYAPAGPWCFSEELPDRCLPLTCSGSTLVDRSASPAHRWCISFPMTMNGTNAPTNYLPGLPTRVCA